MAKGPNSICKNQGCRKAFHACLYCARAQNWRGVACSLECYQAYVRQVEEARAAGRAVDLLPDRTDMDKGEVRALMAMPLKEVRGMALEGQGKTNKRKRGGPKP